MTGPQGGLATWRTALADQATSPATWIAFGDSITEGQGASSRANRWIDKTRDSLRTTLGISGGVGFLPAWYATYGPDSPWQPYSAQTGAIVNDSWGIAWGERSASLNQGATITWTVTGTHADIWWLTNGGTFTWQVDGGATTSVSTTGTYKGDNRTRIALGAAGSHTITVTASTGVCYISGVMAFNGDRDSGVQLIDAGHTGYNSANFTDSDQFTLLPSMVTLAAPDLVTIALGTNDCINGVAVATTKANVVSLIAKIRQAAPAVSVVVVVMYAPAAESAAWPAYATALRSIATDDPTVTLLDLYASMGTATTSGYWRSDALHPSDSGHTYIAQQAAALLAPTSAPVDRVVDRWNGTALVRQRADRWNGTTLVAQTTTL